MPRRRQLFVLILTREFISSGSAVGKEVVVDLLMRAVAGERPTYHCVPREERPAVPPAASWPRGHGWMRHWAHRPVQLSFSRCL